MLSSDLWPPKMQHRSLARSGKDMSPLRIANQTKTTLESSRVRLQKLFLPLPWAEPRQLTVRCPKFSGISPKWLLWSWIEVKIAVQITSNSQLLKKHHTMISGIAHFWPKLCRTGDQEGRQHSNKAPLSTQNTKFPALKVKMDSPYMQEKLSKSPPAIQLTQPKFGKVEKCKQKFFPPHPQHPQSNSNSKGMKILDT